MRIGELARRAGVNIETLRYYERRGLLPAPGRSPRGHRSYDEEAVQFIRAVKQAQGLGFTLAEIEEYLRLTRRSGGVAAEELRRRVAGKIDQVDAKIASLRRVRDDLAQVVGCACDSLDHCTCGAAYLARRGLDPEPESAGTLHVTNGESAGNTLRRSSIGGAVLSWRDVLNEGPLPDVPPAELRTRRAAFLSECGWGDSAAILAGLDQRDRLLDRALDDGRPVVLWFEHDLYDQLQLLQILARVADAGCELGHVELVEIGAFDGHPAFRGLGELTEAELETLWPARRPVSREAAALAQLGWQAVSRPDPTAIEALLGRDLAERPFLGSALLRFLEELPDVTTGLSRSERQLLELLAEGPKTPGALFLESQSLEEAPFDGDAWLWRRLAALGGATRPLVTLAGGGPLPGPPPVGDARAFAAASLAITDDGRDVLAGAADLVDLLGIDRWVGGTHLLPDRLWRWDGEAGRAVAA